MNTENIPIEYKRLYFINSTKTQDEHFDTKSSNCLQLPNGNFYIGESEYGIPNGEGVEISIYTYTSKMDQSNTTNAFNYEFKEIIYEGSFHNGVYDGEGIRYSNNRIVQKGLFSEGRFVEGIFYTPVGLIQCGKFNSLGFLSDEGSVYLPSGGYLRGKWVNGKPVDKFEVFFGAGRLQPLRYDFSDSKDFTISISFDNDCIIYDDRYLLGTSDKILYFYNGDIFVGQCDANKPAHGVYFQLIDGKYVRQTIGDKFQIPIKMDYVDSFLKHAVIRVDYSVENDPKKDMRIPYNDFDYLKENLYGLEELKEDMIRTA